MVETDIAGAEQRLKEISEQMGTPEVARDAVRLIALNEEYPADGVAAAEPVRRMGPGDSGACTSVKIATALPHAKT